MVKLGKPIPEITETERKKKLVDGGITIVDTEIGTHGRRSTKGIKSGKRTSNK
jgi:hypothetical protein